jgi:hypothetical protein
VIVDEDVDAFLEHHGIKGMRWGVRKAERGGVSRAVDKQARKDAAEFARAKMFFGPGAGTRRKLINKSIEARKAHDPSYAKAFDRHVAKQDLSVHASKAVKERTHIDRSEKNKKRAGAVARRLTGEMGTQAAFVALAAGGAAFLNSDKGKATLRKGVKTINNAVDEAHRRRGAAFIRKRLKNM